jgi:hypothetical protein
MGIIKEIDEDSFHPYLELSILQRQTDKIRHLINCRILLSIVHTFYIENDAEIFPGHWEGS